MSDLTCIGIVGDSDGDEDDDDDDDDVRLSEIRSRKERNNKKGGFTQRIKSRTSYHQRH